MTQGGRATRARDLREQGIGRRQRERRRPEETVLYSALQAHWKTFVSELEAAAEPPVLPAFVVAEVEASWRCGILSQGLILAKCRDCGWCCPVAFSCRGCGFCPSCGQGGDRAVERAGRAKAASSSRRVRADEGAEGAESFVSRRRSEGGAS
jgi:hypothetical protein